MRKEFPDAANNLARLPNKSFVSRRWSNLSI
jgi:hypothetical protein